MKWRHAGLLLAAALVMAGCGNTQNTTSDNTAVREEESQTTEAEVTETEEQETEVQETEVSETEEVAAVIEKEWTVSQKPFLKAVGKVLCDDYGNGDVVQLKGTNAGGYMFQEFWMTVTTVSGGVGDETGIYNKLTERFGEEKMEELIDIYQDNYWTEADFDYCAEVGMNCIRLPFWYRNMVDSQGQIKENWFERMDWFVEQASRRGIYVIIDCHGAPGSQNGSDHSGKDGGGNKMAASQFFFGNAAGAAQNLYYQMWEAIAEHYKDNPWVAGYDLLNEPFCTYRYNMPMSDDEIHEHLWDIYDKAYDRIRAIDPDHVIIMEATWDPVDLPDPTKYEWENVMYEYHNYLYDDYNNEKGQQIQNMRNKLDAIKTADYDVPSYMGEFAYFDNLDAWDEGIALINDTGISWTTWTYKVLDSDGNWGIRNQKDLHVKVDQMDYDELVENYSKVGESTENTGLRNVLEKYYKQSYVSAE